MFHIELRQFPHNHCRFNMSEQELLSMVVERWARGEWVDVGERKWSPELARLRVLEGPHLPVGDLSMGRGWRNAERKSTDVTTELLAKVTERLQAAAPASVPPSRPQSQDQGLLSDSLGLELLTRLADKASSLAIVWKLAQERHPERPASECLAIAEGTVRALLGARLAVLSKHADSESSVDLEGAESEAALFTADSWIGAGPVNISVRRA